MFIRSNIYIGLAVLIVITGLLAVGCMSSHPAYTIVYPFVPASMPTNLTQVTVRIKDRVYDNIAPLSMNGFYRFHVTVVEGQIPKHDHLKTFWIAAGEHSATEPTYNSGQKITLLFDQQGNCIMAKEFADEFNKESTDELIKMQRNFPGPGDEFRLIPR